MEQVSRKAISGTYGSWRGRGLMPRILFFFFLLSLIPRVHNNSSVLTLHCVFSFKALLKFLSVIVQMWILPAKSGRSAQSKSRKSCYFSQRWSFRPITVACADLYSRQLTYKHFWINGFSQNPASNFAFKRRQIAVQTQPRRLKQGKICPKLHSPK